LVPWLLPLPVAGGAGTGTAAVAGAVDTSARAVTDATTSMPIETSVRGNRHERVDMMIPPCFLDLVRRSMAKGS
jgi:hypothetical protein